MEFRKELQSEDPTEKNSDEDSFKLAGYPAVLIKQLGSGDINSWKYFNKWLNLQDSTDRIDITHKDVAFIIKELIKHFDNYESLEADAQRILLDTLCSVVNHVIFKQYFQHHSESYCKILSSSIPYLQNSVDVLLLLKPSSTFLKFFDNFESHFLNTLFLPLVTTAARFVDDANVLKEVSCIFQKCITIENQQLATTEDIEIKDELVKIFEHIALLHNQNQSLAKCAYRLLFQGVCNLYGNNFKEVYKFLVVLLGHLGFYLSETFHFKNVAQLQNIRYDLSFSLDVIAEVFIILTNHECLLNCTVNNVTFSEFIKSVVLSLTYLALSPNSKVYSIFHSTVILNPLIIEQIVAEILIYLMIKQHFSTEIKHDYEKFMISIFQVFSKLHRIEKFVSITIQSLKSELEGEFKSEKVRYNFRGTNNLFDKNTVVLPHVQDIFPTTVLNAFSQHVTSLASWQVINIFKTFNYHFTATVELNIDDEKHQHYVEMLSALFCCFLQSVRIAEHTVTVTVQQKFCKAMDDLRLSLSKFGATLLNKEHKQVLMRAYLNICYTWGELCIMLAYYSTDMSHVIAKVEDSDSSLCNLIYLHNYLSREQWCLIAQRITNFGEKPCKQIMHKLYIQKTKAMYAFKSTSYTEMKCALINGIALEDEDSWKILLQEQLFLNHILPEMDVQSILSASDTVLNDCITDNNNLQKTQSLFNCDKLIKGVLYSVLQKINRLFKCKRKSGENYKILDSKQLLSEVSAEMFICNAEIEDVYGSFNRILQVKQDRIICNVNTEKLNLFLNVLKQLPVLHLSKSVQEILLLYFITLLRDCRNILGDEEVRRNLEHVVAGLIQHNPGLLPQIVPFGILFAEIITLFDKWDDVLTTILQATIKNIETLQKLQSGIDYVLTFDNYQFLQWAVILLNVTNDAKKMKLCQEDKTLLMHYRMQICQRINSLLDCVDLNKSLEAYALTLKFYLSHNKLDSLNKVEEMLGPYLDCAITNLSNGNFVNGGLPLLITVLRNKSQLKEFETALPLKIWQASKQITTSDKTEDSNERLQLYMLIFEYVTSEEFALITSDLLKMTTNALYGNELEKFVYYLEIWNSVISCRFKSTKIGIWQNVLAALLKEQLEYLVQSHNPSLLVVQNIGTFQQRIIQAIQLPLTGPITDVILSTPSALLNAAKQDFFATFQLGISLLDLLLKHRNATIMDRLPMYLQQYRHLMKQLCEHGNCNLNLNTNDQLLLSDCAHMLEKLTNSLVQNRKHVIRVAPYLIADFLYLFEQFTLFPNMKIHFNNCLYSLISLCDQHSVAYLMRVLSTASTEMFKILFEHYRKHYRFTGKV